MVFSPQRVRIRNFKQMNLLYSLKLLAYGVFFFRGDYGWGQLEPYLGPTRFGLVLDLKFVPINIWLGLKYVIESPSFVQIGCACSLVIASPNSISVIELEQVTASGYAHVLLKLDRA